MAAATFFSLFRQATISRAKLTPLFHYKCSPIIGWTRFLMPQRRQSKKRSGTLSPPPRQCKVFKKRAKPSLLMSSLNYGKSITHPKRRERWLAFIFNAPRPSPRVHNKRTADSCQPFFVAYNSSPNFRLILVNTRYPTINITIEVTNVRAKNPKSGEAGGPPDVEP